MPYKDPQVAKIKRAEHLLRNVAEIRAKQKAYREKNKEILRAKFKEINSRPERKASLREWRLENESHRASYRREWSAKNHDKVLEQKKRTRQKYGHRTNEYLRDIYPRREELVGKLFNECEGICYICKLEMIVGRDVIELDHYIPVCLKGSHEEVNLRVTHSACNRKKNNKHPSELGL